MAAPGSGKKTKKIAGEAGEAGSRPAAPAVRFRAREEVLDFLLEVATLVSETLDLDRMLAQIGDLVSRVVPNDLFAVLLYSERAGGLRIRHSRGHREEVVRNLIVPLGEGLTGAAAATRQPVVVGDVLKDPRYLAVLDAVRSEAAVPMVNNGKLVGVLDLQSIEPESYTPQDVALLRLLASRVAASIHNARLHKRVARQNRTAHLLLQLSQEFSSTLKLDELLSKIARALHALIEFDAFSVLLVDGEKGVLRHRFSERYDERVQLDNIPLGKGITGAAAELREPVRVADTAADPRYIASHPDIRSEVAVPLIVQDRVVGVMDIESERFGYFTDDHMRTLTVLAPQIASSVENARLYEELAHRQSRIDQDMRAARRVQSVLLPREADIEGLEIAIATRAAREVTGDLYDFSEQSEEHGLVAFGDSSGKGAAAALYGALVAGLLRTLAFRRRHPSDLMKKLNEVLLERKVDAQYVTLLLVEWDRVKRQITLANAGSNLPLVYRPDGRVRLPKLNGVPLGLLDGQEYEEFSFPAQSGDLLLLYSDGVSDQLNVKEQEYGMKRLSRVVRRCGQEKPKTVLDAVLADLDRWSEGVPRSDDQTLVALKVI